METAAKEIPEVGRIFDLVDDFEIAGQFDEISKCLSSDEQ